MAESQSHTGLGSELMTRREAAEYLRVSESTIVRWSTGERPILGMVRLGGKRMYLRSALDAVLTKHYVPPPAQPPAEPPQNSQT